MLFFFDAWILNMGEFSGDIEFAGGGNDGPGDVHDADDLRGLVVNLELSGHWQAQRLDVRLGAVLQGYLGFSLFALAVDGDGMTSHGHGAEAVEDHSKIEIEIEAGGQPRVDFGILGVRAVHNGSAQIRDG